MIQDLHTYKEIKQQPKVWLEACEIILNQKKQIKAFLDKYISEGFEIVMTGAGTSAYIGDALECALFDTPFRGARAIATTDILTAPEFYNKSVVKTLV